MCCVVCFCVVIHRRVSAGAARPRRPPLREVVFCRKWRHRPLVSWPAAAVRHRETLSEGLPGSLRKPPSLPGRGRPPPPACFYPAVGLLGRDLAPRKDAQRWEGGHRCCAPSGFSGWERKVARPSAKRSGDSFCFTSGLPGHRSRRGRRQARPRGCCTSALCVF